MTSARRVFIVGGGPSLKGFDWDLLRGETVLAINMAAVFLPNASPSSWAFVQDRRCLDLLEADPRWHAFPGSKYWPVFHADTVKLDPPHNVTRLNGDRDLDGLAMLKPSALVHGYCLWSSHAGPAALWLAAQRWPGTTLYLLGFDYGARFGSPQNFHDHYARAGWNEHTLDPYGEGQRWDLWRQDLERVVVRVREDHARVVNLSPSAIAGTEKLPMHLALPGKVST